MANTSAFPLEGGCSCRGVRYRMQTAPLVVVEWGDEAIQRFRAAKASVGEESRL